MSTCVEIRFCLIQVAAIFTNITLDLLKVSLSLSYSIDLLYSVQYIYDVVRRGGARKRDLSNSENARLGLIVFCLCLYVLI